jgi:signal transduction histidine kinase
MNRDSIKKLGPETRDLAFADSLERTSLEEVIARLQADLVNRTQEMTLLNKAGQAITATLDLQAVLEQMIVEVNTLLQAGGASVLLPDARGETLIFAAVALPHTRMLVGSCVPISDSIAGWVMQKKQPLLIQDVQQDPRFYEGIDALTEEPTHSLMAVPLIFQERVVGVVEAVNKVGEHGFDLHDLELLETLAGSAAIAIENAHLFEQVQAGHQQMRWLAQQAVSAHEEERQRLSYELHDEAGQNLVALKMLLACLQEALPPEMAPFSRQLGEAMEMADTTMERLRLLARDLRPPALAVVGGVSDTFEEYCREFAKRSGLTIVYEGSELMTLSESTITCLYRFLQETLTNVAKHAQAQRVQVKLAAAETTVSLTVQDDGLGFYKDADLSISHQLKGIGLLGIRERLELLAGRLVVESQVGQGACLKAILPVEVNQ